jgi:hypothetical protein
VFRLTTAMLALGLAPEQPRYEGAEQLAGGALAVVEGGRLTSPAAREGVNERGGWVVRSLPSSHGVLVD